MHSWKMNESDLNNNDDEDETTDLNLSEEDLNKLVMEAGKVWLRLGVENFLLVVPDIGLALSTLKWIMINELINVGKKSPIR